MLGMWWVAVAIVVVGAVGGFALGFLLSLYLKIKRSPYVVKEFVTYGDLDLVATKVAQALRELNPRDLRVEVAPDYSVTIGGKPVNGWRFRFFLDSCEDLVQVRADISYPATKAVRIAVAGKDKGKIVRHLRMRLRIG
jgi:hypothetical protein